MERSPKSLKSLSKISPAEEPCIFGYQIGSPEADGHCNKIMRKLIAKTNPDAVELYERYEAYRALETP